MSCGVGHRCGSNLALLWLWYRLAATALFGPLGWEFSYAMGMALKRQKKKKKVKASRWKEVVCLRERKMQGIFW